MRQPLTTNIQALTMTLQLSRLLSQKLPAVNLLRRNLSSITRGRATTVGTRKFVERANLSLFHCFDKTGLYISPVMHGPPRNYQVEDKEYFEALMHKSIVDNKSNCVVVYNESTGGSKTWHATGMNRLLSEENSLNRSEVVTVANLGVAATDKLMRQRLATARELTGLEHIDMAIFEVHKLSLLLSCSDL